MIWIKKKSPLGYW